MKLNTRHFGISDYSETMQLMQRFTADRTEETLDELWFTEHSPVFTLGRAGKPEHILDAGTIPVINSDRGGQVTYHGPGQLVIYTLCDLKRLHMGVKEFVANTEQCLIDTLKQYRINGSRKLNAPGVYVDGAKIAALGLRIRRQGSYHGMSINIHMDLSPFSRINPCGYAGLAVTQLADHGFNSPQRELSDTILAQFQQIFGYTESIEVPALNNLDE